MALSSHSPDPFRVRIKHGMNGEKVRFHLLMWDTPISWPLQENNTLTPVEGIQPQALQEEGKSNECSVSPLYPAPNPWVTIISCVWVKQPLLLVTWSPSGFVIPSKCLKSEKLMWLWLLLVICAAWCRDWQFLKVGFGCRDRQMTSTPITPLKDGFMEVQLSCYSPIFVTTGNYRNWTGSVWTFYWLKSTSCQ